MISNYDDHTLQQWRENISRIYDVMFFCRTGSALTALRRGWMVMLRDAEGVFVSAEPEMILERGSGVGGMSDGSVQGVGSGATTEERWWDNRGATGRSS